ncbi:MAG TPA: hypothetical protein VJ761_08775, partial [Ktedonobacteraceae bacterium]|nr:hypothetical protein [Ktedonobacteraceae bacterium]
MSLSQVRNQTNQHSSSRRHVEIRLHGRWLLLARTVWIVLVVFTLSLFIMSFAIYAPRFRLVNALLQNFLLHPDTSVNGYIAFDAHLGTIVEYNA